MKLLPQIASCTLVLLLPLLGCQRASDEEKLRAFITTHLEQTEPLMKSGSLAEWNSNATGEKKYYDEQAAAELRIRTIRSNPSDFAFLKDAQRERIGEGPPSSTPADHPLQQLCTESS